MTQHMCLCGNVAAVVRHNNWVCERCMKIEAWQGRTSTARSGRRHGKGGVAATWNYAHITYTCHTKFDKFD